MTSIDVTMTRLCVRCDERPATIPKLGNKQREKPRYCQTCWQAFPANQRAQSTRLNPKRRAKARLIGRRIIRIGARHIGYVKTIEHAEAIKAHIRSRLNAFKRQQAGAEAEALAADAVSTQARHGAD